mmetsp:Transcript_15930/g.13913  ORF Transcript_15930/g.13913 Transcript_15930/m.13913 type:complete len:132 (-) Transcript_15930:38-433(-)
MMSQVGLSKRLIKEETRGNNLQAKLDKLQTILKLMKSIGNQNTKISRDRKIYEICDLRKLEYSGAEGRRDIIIENKEQLENIKNEEELLKQLKLKMLEIGSDLQYNYTKDQKGKMSKNMDQMIEEVIKKVK